VPGEEDLFDHGDFVDRLLMIIKAAPAEHASVNVGLYGSWGSGKSGTANLLKHRLIEQQKAGDWQGHVATFDALTYGRRPLLRRFVVRLAEQLLDRKKAESYRSEVYEQTVRPRVEFPDLTSAAVKRSITFMALGVLGIATVVALLLVFTEGDTREAVKDTVQAVFPALVPTAILVLIVGWLLRFVTVTSTRGVPESDEEFERLFMKLLRDDLNVDRHGDKRLVVFIDELDRCSPKEVVATLESLRTFLGAPGCVFIVAADQQALEHALTEEVRQATPADTANPYYSAGNAYLDKIFQYQLAFPPLRPRRLTHYALRLLEGRGGVWRDVNREDVISVLLPIHVHSPRRVKALLNSFALAYATATARAGRGQLDAKLASRATELAKLVCLRTEFPLFARDLESSDHLPALVLRARGLLLDKRDPRDDAEFRNHPRDVAERAVLYAAGELPVAELLRERSSLSLDAASRRGRDDEGEGSSEDATDDGKIISTVQVAHALQLVAYLEKTADVPGPRSDLIHLDGAGAVWGLDPILAQKLEDDALGNRPADVVAAVRALDAKEDRVKALRLLGARTRESVGTDADNAAKALLAALADAHVPVDEVAPSLVGDVDHYRRRRGLKTEDLPGALSIAVAARHDELLGQLLGRSEAIEQQAYRILLLRATSELWPAHAPRLAEVLAAEMVHDSSTASDALVELPEPLATDLLRGATAHANETLASRMATGRSSETDPETAQRLKDSVQRSLAEIAGVARTLVSRDRKHLAELAFISLTSVGEGLALEREVLSQLALLETTDATSAVLRELSQWEDPRIEVDFLRSLDPKTLLQVPDASDRLGAYGHQLWTVLRSSENDVPDELWDELARLTNGGVEVSMGSTAEAVVSTLTRRIDSEAASSELNQDVALANRLVAANMLDARSVSSGMLRAVAASVASPAPAESEGVAHRLKEGIEVAAGDGEPEDLASLEAALGAEDCWMPSPDREIILVLTAARLARLGRPVEKPDVKQMRALTLQHGASFAAGAAAWLDSFASSTREVFTLVEPYISRPLPEALRSSLESYAESLSPLERTELCRPALERAFDIKPSQDFFRAAQLAAADEDATTDVLVSLYETVDNADERERVLSVWELMDPKSADARRRLIREIFLPLASTGATSFDLARRHLKLCANPPHGTKEQIREALARAAPDPKRAKQMTRRMVEVGLIKEKKEKGWLTRALRL